MFRSANGRHGGTCATIKLRCLGRVGPYVENRLVAPPESGILLAARDAQDFVQGLKESAFLASRLHQYATIRSLEIIGEAAGKVSEAARAAHPEIPWRDITNMRYRLIHGYGDVRLDIVWMVLRDPLGPLIAQLVALVPGESESGG
jgi:uncharacterized protein with HEPN domain